MAWWDNLGKRALDAVGGFLDRILPKPSEPSPPPQSPSAEPPPPPRARRRGRRARRAREAEERARQAEERAKAAEARLAEYQRQERQEQRRREREAQRRSRQRPSRRYPYLVTGTASVVSPENLRSIFPTESIARAIFGDLLNAGVPYSLLAIWATSPTTFELYVGSTP